MKTVSDKLLEMFELDANQAYITLLGIKERYEIAVKNSEKADLRYKNLAEKMGEDTWNHLGEAQS